MLINDILNYARLEAGSVELHLSEVTLTDALSGMEALIAPQLQAKGVAYEYRPCSPRVRVRADREAEDAAGTFGARIAALGADAVIDMVCFTPESAAQLVDALRATRPLLIHCGTIWVHGPAGRVPLTEDEPRTAYGAYGVGKAAIEALLLRETLAAIASHVSGVGRTMRVPMGWFILLFLLKAPPPLACDRTLRKIA